MTDIDILKIIAKKIGLTYEKTTQPLRKKIAYFTDKNNNIIHLSLTECNLSIETIPDEIWALKHLEILSLDTNMLSVFPVNILKLKKLKHLNLSNNQLRIITNKIKKLSSLEFLDLSDNQLEKLPVYIGQIPSLTRLRLNNNRLTSLPSLNPDVDWKKLESIDIDGADIKEIPQWFFSLHSLKYLSLSKLHLNHFPEGIYHLSKLEGLYLDGIHFPRWPKKINLPNNMRYIVLDGAYVPHINSSNISRIPNSIIELKPKYVRNQRAIDLNSTVFQVSLGGNLSEGLDGTQLFNDNPEISYKYLKYLYKDEHENYPATMRIKDIKVMLLGAGAVGKTSLVQRLCLVNPDDDNITLDLVETTHGINLDYSLNIRSVWDETNQQYTDFTLHFWDFGGQDKYRGVNKLLLSDNAIYIIIFDSRTQSMPDTWLEMVEMYAPNSSIIIIANKIDENQKLNINFKYYCERYPRLYNCLFKISCKWPDRGINKITDIIKALRKIIETNINIIAPIWPTEWFNIYSEVNKLYFSDQKDILNKNEFQNICKQHNLINDDEQTALLYALNACGKCIFFDESDKFVLNPNWITDYLYCFYNKMDYKEAVLDYKKEYLPIINQMNRYKEYEDMITDILEGRNLCSVFWETSGRTRTKKIFFPMFLTTDSRELWKSHLNKPTLKYKFKSHLFPEFEFHTFLTQKFVIINQNLLELWQFGVYFNYLDSDILIELQNDGLYLNIWSSSGIQCGNCFSWIQNSIIHTSNENFFQEYVIITYQQLESYLPFKLLQLLNKLDWDIYYYPQNNNSGNLIPIDVKTTSVKCGLPEPFLTDGLKNIKNKMSRGECLMIKIENMYGDINETHGDNSPIFNKTYSSGKLTETDKTILKELNNLYNLLLSDKKNYQELKTIIEDFKNFNPKQKSTLKEKLESYLSNLANIVTISSIYPTIHDSVIKTVSKIIELL